ncbi:hypothetical protein FB451DRAFT_1461111 [Mycena latifolia]|nr:hypothetical protein FB451DRAFT_1461111 [Mycena latifolia]
MDDILAVFTCLPFEQLTEFRCVEAIGDQPAVAMAMASRLAQAATLTLPFSRLDRFRDLEVSFQVPSTRSNISVLRIAISERFSPAHARQVVERVFQGFALPSLTTLGFTLLPRESIIQPSLCLGRIPSLCPSLRVPHFPFISTPSTCGTSQSRKPIFFECPASLLALEKLTISDHDNAAEALITDTLLAALTRTPHSEALIPRLRFFECLSALQFDGTVFLNSLVSRVSHARPFDCELLGLAGHERQLDPAVSAKIHNLCAENQLKFLFSPGD